MQEQRPAANDVVFIIVWFAIEELAVAT